MVPTARFRQAKAALEACFEQLDEGGVTLEATEHEAIEQILALHDQQHSVFRAIDTPRRMSAYNNSRRLDDQRFLSKLNDDALTVFPTPSVIFRAAVNKLEK
ncbi:hypothetical protein [Burkholderia gladioli]|uniref:hypothetical protein n=1 Tax=Burkholderia gladioli TaxID=28095 RepID=UPI0020B33CA9|nr:hypothetical protein [Burkholderia gladioli]MDN7728305.1 hypothetical protein [Burkholderia gladioli]